ncbi:MAG TPA: glycosyltransferase [Solirubrobacteraceae bacterium]|nr:glycosyltransferase [Solirubrobacteraceae bacterium]
MAAAGRGLPRVSAIVLTYQFEEYVARSVESVLAQDYPSDLLEVIVIDDGSTDGTRDALAPYLDRVRYIYKENGGLLSSVNRGFAEAGGELIALQSGDDEWTPQKLAAQVEVMRTRPQVGLVYGDMEVVDAELKVLHPSFWQKEGIEPQRGRPLGSLVRANFVSGGTMLVRSSLRERFHPLPSHAGWEDWWIAVRVAEVAELDYVAQPMLRYRQHDANMNLGADATRARAKAAQEMPFRRWLLTDLAHEQVTPADLLVGCRLYEHCVASAAAERAVETTEVAPGDAERVGEHVRAGWEHLARGEMAPAMSQAARAFGHDLHDPRARDLLDAVAAMPPERKRSLPRRRRAGSGEPRVTLGVATFNRDTYLREAIASCLAQDYDSFELLVVDDGSTNPAIDEALSGFDDPRLRVVRHPENRGIAQAYNTMVSEGRGELIAMLGDDDVCMPDRLARQVAVFDAYPDAGVVHGDALVIDSSGRASGSWRSRDFTPAALVQSFFRAHNYLVDPTRMVRRRVYEAVGGYDSSYKIAQDLHFWLRAARDFRFRHCQDAPLIGLRRHGENTSDESARELEVRDVERALEEAMTRFSLRELVPELDWAVLDPPDAERQALCRLAEALEKRALPLPALAQRVRSRAQHLEDAPRVRRGSAAASRRLLMTSFGWNDSGGGTTVPRLAAKELVRRGWEVTVFHAATRSASGAGAYAVVESEEDGVRLLGVHNRAHGIWDLGNPLRELDDPAITAEFAAALDRLRPDVVHFHNLHNLGAALIDHAAARGVPSFFSTHNYWLICPRAYLMGGSGEICPGPGDGERCASCVQSPDPLAHRMRLEGIRARVSRGVSVCLAVSEAVRRTLIGAGYPAEMIDVVRQGMPHDGEIWRRLGRERVPGRVGEALTVAFLGSAYPHKGPQLLVAAAQQAQADLRVQIHGEVPDAFAKQLLQADERGVVELCGPYQPSEIERVLAGVDVAALPSTWWDCAPLAAAECLAARVPVLAPRLGGLAEAVEHERDGLLFDALDSGDLARCLERLVGEPGLLERLQAGIGEPRRFGSYVDELEAYYAGERPGGVAVSSSPAAVRWQGDHGACTSLSIVNDRVSERLSANVQRVARSGRPVDPPLPHGADLEVRHQWPPDLNAPAAGRLAVIQPWEFGAIPREWVAPLRERVDELWVPSEATRRMYLAAGVDPERVVAIPNGVDLEAFHPRERHRDGAKRFLFVGGLIWRKGCDVLLDAWREAFSGRDDVVLIVKDVGAAGVYRGADRSAFVEYARSGALPRLELLDAELADRELADLYRSCDVLVHPYRGEGFAMPVLEAMACGLPSIVTAGGPTDEFCPADAGWRIRADRALFSTERVGDFDTVGHPWVLEPDAAHLVELLRAAAACDATELERRGRAARAAAERYSWDAIAALYQQRIDALAAVGAPRLASAAVRDGHETTLRLLATPAWRGEDRLHELLALWQQLTAADTNACLQLLADPRVDGGQEELSRRILASGVDLDAAADIDVLCEPIGESGDARIHAAADAFVALHGACQGHARLATKAGTPVIALEHDAIAGFLSSSRVPALA